MIRFLIDLYILILIADAVLSYLPQFRHAQWAMFIKQIADVTLKPIRKFLPQDLPIDISPIIVILLLNLFVAIF